MSQTTVSLDTELRKLKPAELYTLGQILNISDSWKKLMAIIPREGATNLLEFNAEHLDMIEQAVHQQRRSAAEIFLDEWGTLGKNRPTLRTLLDILVKAELFRAADYVAEDILKDELPKRPKCGPAASVDISDEAIKKLLEKKVDSWDNNLDRSLVLEFTSEINASKIIYPSDRLIDAVNDRSIEANMQSTKLDSTNKIFSENSFQKIDNFTDQGGEYIKTLPKARLSNLRQFGTDEYNAACCIYAKQELSSRELPAPLNEFRQTGDQSTTVAKSESLDTRLKNSTVASNKISYDDDNSYSSEIDSDAFGIANLNVNSREITSMELPESVIERGSNTSQTTVDNEESTVNDQNNLGNTLSSQELPATVLEYR